MMEELKKSGVSAAEIAAKEAEFRSNMELYKNPFFMIAITFLEIFPVGLVIDLISAFLLRNNAPKPENANWVSGKKQESPQEQSLLRRASPLWSILKRITIS